MVDNPENKVEAGAEAEVEAEVGAEAEAEAEAKTDEEPKSVPYARFKEVVATVERLEKQVEEAAQQAAIAKANPVQGPQAPAPQVDIFKEVGLDPDDAEDIPNQGQLKQILGHYGKVFDTRLAQLAEMQTLPDYVKLVGTADELASGQYAAPLAAAIKANPALIKDIANSSNPRLAAYNIAKLQSQKPKGKAVTTDEAKEVIDEAVENAGKVKSSANVKGGESLSEEGRYATMSDKDFLKLALSHGAII